MARVTRGASFTIAGVVIVVSFDTEVFDTGEMWAAGDPTRMYATIPGVYAISAGADFQPNGTAGTRYILVEHSVSSDIGMRSLITDGGGQAYLNTADTFKMQAGESMRLLVFQTSGVNQTVLSARLAMSYLGPG